ncbi:MAG TPA: DUF1326 domain-containing protein [Chloroflexota bacterium]|nr:DUF1326 domain-containing protein [Chloroflexota bacterium]
MSFRVAGDYFESCTCDVSCNCIFLGLATQDHCDVVIGWHITDGRRDQVDLRGLNAAMVIRSPKRMLDGNWQVALYLDDRADQPQAEALGAIFSGQAGGHLAALGPLIGKVAGVTNAPITFESHNGKRRLAVGTVIEGEISEVPGGDGKTAPVITNAPFGALPQPVRQGHSEHVHYDDHWQTDLSGTNAFLAEFAYEG